MVITAEYQYKLCLPSARTAMVTVTDAIIVFSNDILFVSNKALITLSPYFVFKTIQTCEQIHTIAVGQTFCKN